MLPVVGYSLQTGMVGGITGNLAFYNAKKTKISNIKSTAVYTAQKQTIFYLASNIWTKQNRYNLVGNFGYLHYPQTTYGLGGNTQLSDASLIDYSLLRIYETGYKRLASDFLVGIGYNLDYHWGVKEVPEKNESGEEVLRETDFKRYGVTKTSSSSALTFNLLFDSRNSSINPHEGVFANAILKSSMKVIGSNTNWQSLVIDLRKYYQLPGQMHNVLAFWGYSWLTLGGRPPYLDLPSTGWDNSANTGRGYIQGRFRGANMLYTEAEYRFGLTKNGFLGGVVFANAESFTDAPGRKFQGIEPGYGAGVRIKMNKYSNTNLAVDYGFGNGGSRGLFLTICELF